MAGGIPPGRRGAGPPGRGTAGPPRRRDARPGHSEQALRSLGQQISADRGGGPSRVANERALVALGDRIDRAGRRSGRSAGRSAGRTGAGAGAGAGATGARLRRSGRRRWSRRRKVVTTLGLVLVLAVAVVVGTYGYVSYRFDQLSKLEVPSLSKSVPGQPFNLLVIGSDSRAGLSRSQAAQIGSASEVQGQRSDVVQIWHVDPGTKQISVISIPRDTLVTMVGSDAAEFGRYNRINATFNGPQGVNNLVSTIEDNFGIPINHIVEVDFGGFEGAVDAIGGIRLDFPYPAKDAYSGLDIAAPGCQLLDGSQALAVARSRHYEYEADGTWQYDGTGDFGRIDRQDVFLRALISAARSKDNPLALNAFVGSLHQGLVIDSAFSKSELVDLALAFHSFSPQALATTTLPTLSDGDIDPWGDVLFVDQPAAQQALVQIFGNQLYDPPDPPPDTDLYPNPPPVVTGTTAAVAPAAASATRTGTRTVAQLDSDVLASSAATTATTATTTPPFDPTPC